MGNSPNPNQQLSMGEENKTKNKPKIEFPPKYISNGKWNVIGFQNMSPDKAKWAFQAVPSLHGDGLSKRHPIK